MCIYVERYDVNVGVRPPTSPSPFTDHPPLQSTNPHTAPRQPQRARGAVAMQATAPPAEAELFAKHIMATYGRYPITMVK